MNPALGRIEAELLAPGGAFELASEAVLGEPMSVFAKRQRSLRELLEASARFGDAEYLVFGERRLTFAEHRRAVASVARALRERFGVGPGDRVAILAANCPEWVIAFWAAVSLGAVAVGMNGWWAGDEIRYAIEDSQPAVLIGDTKRLARLRGSPGVPVVEIESGIESLARFDPGAALPDHPIDEDDAACILYTSGTTGRPKGAVNTHRNILALLALQQFHGARLMALAEAELGRPLKLPDAQPCRLTSNPLFHVSGVYTGAVAHLASGVRSVWTVGRFDPEQVLRLIERERVEGWSPQGAMAPRLLASPALGKYDVSSVRALGCGGAPLPPRVQEQLRAAFPGAELGMAVGYGLTEGTALATLNFGEELSRHPESVGRPLPTVGLEIRDEAGRVVPEGEQGEITLRGPLVMREYFRNPEATRASIVGGRWLRTGDLGRIEGGRLYVATRQRDLILRGGENVYPAEIESRLVEHPAVVEAAVFGVDSEALGQEVKAAVVCAQPITEHELASFLRERLAYYKVPSHWQLQTEPLPKTATGKVMKHVLIDPTSGALLDEDPLNELTAGVKHVSQ